MPGSKLIVKEYKEELLARRIRRLTFICGHKDGSTQATSPSVAPPTRKIRAFVTVEPALAFQLELGRLSKFDIKPVFTENRNIHVYEAIGKDVRELTSATSPALSFVPAVFGTISQLPST